MCFEKDSKSACACSVIVGICVYGLLVANAQLCSFTGVY